MPTCCVLTCFCMVSICCGLCYHAVYRYFTGMHCILAVVALYSILKRPAKPARTWWLVFALMLIMIHNYGAWAAAGKLPIVLLWLADHIVSSALMFVILIFLLVGEHLRSGGQLEALTLSCLVFISFETQVMLARKRGPVTSNTDPAAILALISSVASIIANAMATGMIGIVAWHHLREHGTGIGHKNRAARVVLYLAES
ncbi:hypothetical protein BDV98DRAFT_340675 [Pterulicium gracile]|uniref:Uncharacterized protein n=1 Tax=Pterulicium gracile TaxID=1884261 RepID=A0A5C3Q6X6_9AGAR|nr:hypothetical protein BDV98DRAFT_340675 [Pterula gracilis]